MRVFLILLLMCVAVSGQTSNQTSDGFRQKYGKPKSETFEVRPKVELTLTYGKSGNFCTATIEPTPMWLGANKFGEDTNVLKRSIIKEIFDELFPKEKRGKLLYGPRHGRDESEYENVALPLAGKFDAHIRGIIVVRNDECK